MRGLSFLKKVFVSAIILLIAFIIFGCGGGGSSSTLSVSLNDDSAPPGALITLEGLDPNTYSPADLEVFLKVEGETLEEEAFVVSDGQGGVGFVVPVYYDDTSKWSAPPDQAVDIEILHMGESIATLSQAFTVEPLLQAPGTTDNIVADIRQIVQDVTAISDFFPREVNLEDQYLSVILGVLDTLVNGDSPYSLPTVMADIDADPDSKALLDALFVTSGAAEHIAKIKELIASLSQPVPPVATFSFFVSEATAATIPTAIGDTALAKKIQLYEIVQLFGQEVVSSTALMAGTVAGVVGVVASLPPVAVAQAIITVIDFVLNKLYVAVLPSHLTGIELSLADTQLELDQVTEATVTLRAANTPVPITLSNMVSYVLNILGFSSGVSSNPGVIRTFEEALTNTLAFVTAEMQSRLSDYAQANPGSEVALDMNLGAAIPAMTWEADATNRDLLTLFSSAPSILATLPHEINWQADSENRGTSSIHIQTASGPGTLLWNLPSWLTYAGGAYGTNAVSSESITVNVASALGLEASFPDSILPSGSGVLHVLAGDLLPDDSIDPKEGISVGIVATGGSPEESSGLTDAQGQFTTVVWPDEGVSEMVIHVFVDDLSADLSAEMTLAVTVGAEIIPLVEGSVHLGDNHGIFYPLHTVQFDAPEEYSTATLEFDIQDFDIDPTKPNIGLNGVRLGVDKIDLDPNCIETVDFSETLGPSCIFEVYNCMVHLNIDISSILLRGMTNTFSAQTFAPPPGYCTNNTTNYDDYDLSNVRIILR